MYINIFFYTWVLTYMGTPLYNLYSFVIFKSNCNITLRLYTIDKWQGPTLMLQSSFPLSCLISFMLPAMLQPHTSGEHNNPVRGFNNVRVDTNICNCKSRISYSICLYYNDTQKKFSHKSIIRAKILLLISHTDRS